MQLGVDIKTAEDQKNIKIFIMHTDSINNPDEQVQLVDREISPDLEYVLRAIFDRVVNEGNPAPKFDQAVFGD